MSSSTVQFINVTNYYDLPLEAYLRVDGRYWYARLDNDAWKETIAVYGIYRVTNRPLFAYHLQDFRKFRHMVGWHESLSPSRAVRNYNDEHIAKVAPATKETAEEYFKARPNDVILAEHKEFVKHIEQVGTSTDYLQTVVWFT